MIIDNYRTILALKENEPTAAITSIGNAVPPFIQEQSRILEIMSTALQLNKLEKRLFKTMHRESGIQRRYSVLKDFCEARDNSSFSLMTLRRHSLARNSV